MQTISSQIEHALRNPRSTGGFCSGASGSCHQTFGELQCLTLEQAAIDAVSQAHESLVVAFLNDPALVETSKRSSAWGSTSGSQ